MKFCKFSITSRKKINDEFSFEKFQIPKENFTEVIWTRQKLIIGLIRG